MRPSCRAALFFVGILSLLCIPLPATPQTAQTPSASLALFSTRSGWLLLLLVIDYPAAYWILCKSVVKSRPIDFTIIIFESFAFFLLAVFLFEVTRGSSVIVLALTVYFIFRLWHELERVQATKAAQDATDKQTFIKTILPYTQPLLRFLASYRPDRYPPPISRRMAMSISSYAKLLCELDRVNGKPHPSLPDFELLRSYYQNNRPISETSFPSTWDSQKILDFCVTFMEIVSKLGLTADLNLEANTQYEAELTAFFEAKTDAAQETAYAQLPPFVRERMNSVEKYLREGKDETPEQKIEHMGALLISLIPDHLAKTRTVIGTPGDGLPVTYDSLESRYRHTFLIGRSGAGKSTVITNLVAQDIDKGYGVIVMSPDQDLMHRIIPYIPDYRLDDVIYFDPSDTTPPIIGFNPFSFEPPHDPRAYQLLKSRKAGETYTILERTLGLSTQEGMQTLLNNAMHALIGRPHTTINELRRLLDPKERALHQEVAHDPRVDDYTREFWETYATEGANALVYRNLIRRMANLLRPPLYDIFSTQSFSFHREINEHARILLIDLSNFSRDSMEAKITAQLLIATIQQTILRRDKMSKENYIPYFMYIDEFQNFADTNEKSIGDMAEQLRKYSFGLTLTSLVASDLSSRLFDTIIGVMSTFICLSISAKDAGRFASEMRIKREDRDSFNTEALQKLQRGQAYVLTPPLDAAVFVQMPEFPPGNLPKLPTTIDDLKKRSKANFGAMVKPPAPAAVDSDTRNEHVAEPPNTPPAPETPAQTETPKNKPAKRTTRRRSTRFDDDKGNPEIEIEVL